MTNETSTPSMESPEAYAAEIIQNAVRFTASLFLGRGEYANAEATTREEIEKAAEQLSAEHPSAKAKPIITAYDAAGNQTIISGKPYKSPVRRAKEAKAAVRARAKALNAPIAEKAPKAEKPAKEKAPKPEKPAAPLGKRAQIAADAEAGILPPKPDFSAETHKRFRKKLDEVAALVEKADIKALKAYPINPISSSPKALDKYRNLAVIALEAQRKAAKAKAEAEVKAAE